MKKNDLKQRIFDTKTFYRHLKNMTESLNDLIRYKMSGNMDKAFTEKIMLAVTEVNGCRYCNYLHTKLALKAGVSKEDIQILLNGQFENISPDEAHALMFAQHYADTGGYPDSETYYKFVDFYGDDKAKGIMSIIKAIMVGNIYGLSIDVFINRIKRNSLPGSKFKDEVLIIIGIIVFIPVICIQIFTQRLFKPPAICLKTIKKSLSKLTSCV
jgi:AhpD family alkylhydroperoxidase